MLASIFGYINCTKKASRNIYFYKYISPFSRNALVLSNIWHEKYLVLLQYWKIDLKLRITFVSKHFSFMPFMQPKIWNKLFVNIDLVYCPYIFRASLKIILEKIFPSFKISTFVFYLGTFNVLQDMDYDLL